MGNLPTKLKREELMGIVDEAVLKVVTRILSYAEEKLERVYDDKVYFALALHLNASLERIKDGKKIYHPKLNVIRVQYEKEFMVAMEVAKIIDKSFDVQVPLDEIGYLTLFLATESQFLEAYDHKGVFVLVVTHGGSTATSMVQVAKALVDAEQVIGLDMSLTMKAEHMYEIVKEEILKRKDYDGVILLVDMGSLCNFGDMIYEETGMSIKTIDMVSTPIVLEACRKASLGRELQEIYHSCKEMQQKSRRRKRNVKHNQDSLILTACFTGEGASEKLKQVIEENISSFYQVRIESINILNRKEYLKKIESYQKDYRLLAIVGTIDIDITGVPFISAVDIFTGQGIERIKKILAAEEAYYNIIKSLKEHITVTSVEKLVNMLRSFIDDVMLELQLKILNEVKTGILLHLSFLVEKLLLEEAETPFENLEDFKSQYSREFIQIKQCFASLEDHYQISVSDDEIAYLCKMFINNNAVV
jgi:transcriptional regulatory protein LevR